MKREIEAPRGGGSAAGEQTITKYLQRCGENFQLERA
jgi:hypothetical protein